jgi:uncharacterized protein YecE (DUF72 family)
LPGRGPVQHLTVWIGTSGWQYRDWRGPFYPTQLAQARWLERYAAAFATVESNNAFYRLPERHVFEAWAERTPDDFVMAVKMSRFLTHVRRLRDPAEPVERFLDRARGLGGKLGPVLIQLPPQLRADPGRLTETLGEFPPGVRVAVEFRHRSWFTDEVRSILERHGAALCLADRRGLLTPVWRTAGWTYLRFHEGRAAPRPCYGRTTLRTWIDRIRDGWGADAEAWVYFNNDPRGCAPRDAARFGAMAARAGLHPSHTPPVRSIHPRRAP